LEIDTGHKTFLKHIKIYLESLNLTQKITADNSSNLWIIVISYYAMYYISNALLLKIGYKVGDKISHKVTSDALIVFIRNKLRKEFIEEYEAIKEDALELMSSKTDSLLQSLDFEREKRSKFQYRMDEQIKKSKASTSLERAKQFVFELKKLL